MQASSANDTRSEALAAINMVVGVRMGDAVVQGAKPALLSCGRVGRGAIRPDSVINSSTNNCRAVGTLNTFLRKDRRPTEAERSREYFNVEVGPCQTLEVRARRGVRRQ